MRKSRSATLAILAAAFLLLLTSLSAAEKTPLEEWNAPLFGGPCELASNSQIGIFEPAAIEVPEGFSAEWFVKPGTFNMPQRVMVTPDNLLLVMSGRSDRVFTLSANGEVLTSWPLSGGRALLGTDGSVYSMGGGTEILRRRPDGQVETFAQTPDVNRTGIEAFAFGPKGEIYVGLGDAGLFRVSTTGVVEKLDPQPPLQLDVYYTAPDGKFYGARWDTVYEISLPEFELTELCRIPHDHNLISEQGLVSDNAGNLYISTGNRDSSGAVYRYSENKGIVLLSLIPDNGLTGIDWLPKTNEIVGCQLVHGGLVAVQAETGEIRYLIEGNGLVTPMLMAFSSCGSLAVVNDDGGMLALVSPTGDVYRFFGYGAYVPPISQVVFDPDNRTYVTQGCSSFPGVIVVLDPEVGRLRRYAEDLHVPSGLGFRSDGELVVTECAVGQVTLLHENGTRSTIAEGLTFPQALAIGLDDTIYVVTGGSDRDSPWGPFVGDRITQVSPSGVVANLAELPGVMGLTIGPDGSLYASAWSTVYRLALDGRVSPFARGFVGASGLAFDAAGRLYISDHATNGIVRISGSFPDSSPEPPPP